MGLLAILTGRHWRKFSLKLPEIEVHGGKQGRWSSRENVRCELLLGNGVGDNAGVLGFPYL